MKLDSEGLQNLEAIGNYLMAQKHPRSRGHAAQIRALTRPRRRSRGDGKEQAATLSYLIRCELYPKRWRKKIRGTVARIYDLASDTPVACYVTKHGKRVKGYLKLLDRRADYDGLTRRQMLLRELRALERNQH